MTALTLFGWVLAVLYGVFCLCACVFVVRMTYYWLRDGNPLAK